MPATPVARDAEKREIPDKLYFRIGEVTRLSGVKQHVLRYWETEFPTISPKKSGSGHRLYRRKDVELILEIKRLLYEERFTIEGAKKFLAQRQKRVSSTRTAPVTGQGELFGLPTTVIDQIRSELKDILELLK